MAERERRQLDAIARVQRLFLSGEDASVLRAEIVAAAVELAGARSGFLLEEGPRDEPEAIARYWCERHAIPFLGPADIGHDAANKIVPFGLASDVGRS